MRYIKEKTREISFPLGGIGSGCVGLAGNGRLIDWEIFNASAKGSVNGCSHFAIRAEVDGKVTDFRILNGDLEPPYTGAVLNQSAGYCGFGWGPQIETLCGYPHFRQHEFSGEYPFAAIRFSGEKFPGEPLLHAWSPLIPGNADDSSLPAAVFAVEITNPTAAAIRYSVIGVLANPWNKPGHWNAVEGRRLTVFQGGDPDDPAYGDLSLTLLSGGDAYSFQEYWYRGGWFDPHETYLYELQQPGLFANRTYPVADTTVTDHGLLAAHFELQPGETRQVHFCLTWNVPHRRNHWNPEADAAAARAGISNHWKNWYATVWPDSRASAEYLATNYERLEHETELFRRTLFNSSLPEAVLDAVSANISILKSPTCLRLEDGTFYGWEGVGVSWGSCEGSCAHVWNYAQTLPFLFPQLERSMRESHLRYSVDSVGGSHFRLLLPLGIHADINAFRPCADGQFGDVMKVFRDWKISGDAAWLERWYPTLKRTLAYAWSDANGDRWDPGMTGVLTGRQHHTLDMELFGPNAWLTGHYLGALLAMVQISAALGDDEFAALCRKIYERGKRWVKENLFNGEYFQQQINLGDRTILAPYAGADAIYWNAEKCQIKYQLGNGCAIDTPLAQWYATLYGIGEIFDPVQNRSTLQAIFKYNFRRSMRDCANSWRNYSLNDEAGVQICTWPGGDRPVIPVPYNTETMHGFEWSLAAQLIAVGMVDEGLAVVCAIRDHYDGGKRNPWNEIECGSNYARSMAAYGLLGAFSRLVYDRGAGLLGFDPVYVPAGGFRCFWALGDVWGELLLNGTAGEIKVAYGSFELRQLSLPRPAAQIEFAGEKRSFSVVDKRHILAAAVTLTPENGLKFTLAD